MLDDGDGELLLPVLLLEMLIYKDMKMVDDDRGVVLRRAR
jgi:hypothetical protein